MLRIGECGLVEIGGGGDVWVGGGFGFDVCGECGMER